MNEQDGQAASIPLSAKPPISSLDCMCQVSRSVLFTEPTPMPLDSASRTSSHNSP